MHAMTQNCIARDETYEDLHMRTNQFRIDNYFGSILQRIILSGVQKPNKAIILLLFAMKTNHMEYSKWRFGEHEGTMQSDIQTWNALCLHDNTSVCPFQQEKLFADLNMKMYKLEHLSSGELQYVISIYQYKQWMAQFNEIKINMQLTELMTANVVYVELLLQFPEKEMLDQILNTLESTCSIQFPSITITASMIDFLYLLHSKLQVLIDPAMFDSIPSAANKFDRRG